MTSECSCTAEGGGGGASITSDDAGTHGTREACLHNASGGKQKVATYINTDACTHTNTPTHTYTHTHTTYITHNDARTHTRTFMAYMYTYI
jgi:hypothetical protein